MTCESGFRVAGLGLSGTQAKVVSRLSDACVATVSLGKVGKGAVQRVWSVKCAVESVECEM